MTSNDSALAHDSSGAKGPWGLSPPTAVMELIRRRIYVPTSIAFVALAFFFALAPELPAWVVVAPFAASVLFLGLPHGALDHLVPARLAGRRPSVASIASVALLYVLLGSAVFFVWSVAPAIAFAGFIAITWFHWGQGDLWVELAEDPSGRLSGRVLRAGTIFVRGGLPMLLPLLFHPETYELVRVGTLDLFGKRSLSTGFLGLGPSGRLTLGICFGLIVLAMAVATWFSARTRRQRIAWAHSQMEIAALSLFFALGSPVLTVGLYFCLWHSVRHIVRLELLDPRGAELLGNGRFVGSARRFAVDAAPITAIAILILGAIYFAIPPQTGSPETVIAPFLVLVSALTVPHIAIVSFMDLRQGVWARA